VAHHRHQLVLDALHLAAAADVQPQLDLGDDAGGEVGEHAYVALRPAARGEVPHAQRSQRVSPRHGERNAEVRLQLPLGEEGAAGEARVGRGVFDDDRLAGSDGPLAVGVVQRRLRARLPLRRGEAALGELAPVVQHVDQGQRSLQELGREAGDPVEGVLGSRVQQTGGLQLGEPCRIRKGVQRVGCDH
jgi:hypothetical protein